MGDKKLILANEAAECGLASLAMIANALGYKCSLAELRKRFPMSLRGMTLTKLIAVAGSMKLQARALRLELEEVSQLKLPCILHWGLDHFVVLTGAGPSSVTILDPAFGERKVGHAEFSEHFSGIALELTRALDFKPKAAPAVVSIRQLTGHVTGLWRTLGLVLLLSLALQVCVVVSPFFLQWVIDQVLVAANADLLTVLALGFGVLLLLRVGISLLRSWVIVHLSSQLSPQWMGSVFSHLLKLPLDFFEKRHMGDIVSRMGSVKAIQGTLTTSFVAALIDGLMAIVTFAMMIVYSWQLALITVAAVAAYLILRLVSFHPLRNGVERQLVAGAKFQSHLLESIRGIQSVKVAGVEQQRESGCGNLMNDTVNREVWLAKLGLGFGSANGLIFGVERIVVIWIAALLVLQNEFSVGMLIAYLAYKDQFAGRIGGLIDKWIEFRMLRLHGERLADIVLTPPEQDAAQQYELPPPASTRIEVKRLSFAYADGEPPVLDDCSFTVEEGEAVAIVGASGCGKTTLVKLLLGLLQPTAGCIRVGGQDIAKLGGHNYRAMLGAVMQDDQLFAGSVSDNIAFGEDGFDPARVEAAARLAAVHDEVAAMPMGYHSLIGDMGTNLSGGQKQRVILARALYRNPRLLFLDEATSHLDVEREQLVNQAVHGLQLTKVIVAHRPETIASADRVLTLAGGRIVHDVRAQQTHPSPQPSLAVETERSARGSVRTEDRRAQAHA